LTEGLRRMGQYAIHNFRRPRALCGVGLETTWIPACRTAWGETPGLRRGAHQRGGHPLPHHPRSAPKGIGELAPLVGGRRAFVKPR